MSTQGSVPNWCPHPSWYSVVAQEKMLVEKQRCKTGQRAREERRGREKGEERKGRRGEEEGSGDELYPRNAVLCEKHLVLHLPLI